MSSPDQNNEISVHDSDNGNGKVSPDLSQEIYCTIRVFWSFCSVLGQCTVTQLNSADPVYCIRENGLRGKTFVVFTAFHSIAKPYQSAI